MLLFHAALAGTVAVAASAAIERWGGRRGGLLATLPTTIVPASWGLWNLGPEPFIESMSATPGGMWLNVLFLGAWRWLPPYVPGKGETRLLIMVGVSLSLWLVGAALLVSGRQQLASLGLSSWAFGTSATALLALTGLAAQISAPSAPAGRRRTPTRLLLARGLLAGLAIAVALGAAPLLGAFPAGVASVFPAIFLTTMVSLWLAQGEAVQAGAVGPMMLGALSVPAYALLATWTFPWLGPLPGAAAAWVGAVLLATLPAGWVVQTAASWAAPPTSPTSAP